MSLQLGHAYAFVGGAFVGRFTGIIPSVIISGLLLYVADSSIFTVENISNNKNTVMEFVKSFIK